MQEDKKGKRMNRACGRIINEEGKENELGESVRDLLLYIKNLNHKEVGRVR